MDEVCGSGVRPALGLAWAEQVTVRLMLTRREGVGHDNEEEEPGKVRWFAWSVLYNIVNDSILLSLT